MEGIVSKLGIGDRVRQIGHVTPEELSAIYRETDIYVMPSLYEGFSMTILEAMEAGCAVMASNVSSHPEVAGDAALMFDPYSTREIESALLTVSLNQQVRSKLVERGKVQAAKYSWVQTAERILAVMHGLR